MANKHIFILFSNITYHIYVIIFKEFRLACILLVDLSFIKVFFLKKGMHFNEFS